MNSRMFLPIVLAFATVLGVQWYFGNKVDQSVQSGVVQILQQEEGDNESASGVVKVRKRQDLNNPLNVSLDFAEQKNSVNESIEVVETPYLVATFSSFGGQLKEVAFKDYLGKNGKPLTTVSNQLNGDQALALNHCFLLAFDEETPYNYRLVNRISDGHKEIVSYQAETSDWTIEKVFTLYHDSYKVDVEAVLKPKRKDAKAVKPRLFFTSPTTPELLDDTVTPFVLNESNKSIEKSDLSKIGDSAWYWSASNIIFGSENRYFTHTLINDGHDFVQRAYFDRKIITDKANPQKTVDVLSAILEGPLVNVSDKKTSWGMSFYVGPKVQQHLSQVDSRLEGLLSFGWLSWFCKLMLKLLGYLYKSIGNYGLAIIALTVVVRIPFAPLTMFSRRRMEEYQKHQPHINRIRTKFKNEAQVQQQEIIRYHREHNLSPATPIIGCMPLLVQIPILLSLYRVLWSYLDLYQAPFFAWITDLSAKDPYYVLPVLMGVTMIWQQSLTAVQDEKQRVISWFMGVVMTVLFASFPAGLVLYWLMNNILTLLEDYARKLFVAR